MGQKIVIALRAAQRVALASAGEITGRAINLILPFLVLHLYSADDHTDRFFFVFAIGFFVFGTLSNILTSVFVPVFVSDKEPRNIGAYVRWSTIVAGLAGVVAVALFLDRSISTDVVILGISTGIMAMAGLLSAPSIAVLNSEHRYLLPGLTLGFRAIPIGLFWAMHPDRSQLPFLLSGLAVADSLRAHVLCVSTRSHFSTNSRYAQLKVPGSALHLVIAGLIAGSSPVVIRWIASLGDPGTLSIFELADRLYSAVASLASIGMGTVVLVYLARLETDSEVEEHWNWIVGATLAWGVLWTTVSVGLWALFPHIAAWISINEGSSVNLIRSTYLGLVLGMPAFVLNVALSRRLFTAGLSRHLVPMALVGFCFNAVAGMVMFDRFGTIGLAAAFSLSQYLVSALMYRRIRKFRSGLPA